MKIIFLGNLVLDSIFYLDKSLNSNKSNQAVKFEYNIGGIGNNLKFFEDIQKRVYLNSQIGSDIFGLYIIKNLKSKFVDLKELKKNVNSKTSFATVVIDKDSYKSSFVKWDACKKKTYQTYYRNAWCHFSYIELLDGLKIEYLKKLNNNNCIISADMCSSFFSQDKKKNMFKYLKFLNYLIISDNEAFGLFPNKKKLKNICFALGKLVKDFVIIHHPTGSFYSNGEILNEYLLPKKNLINENKINNLNGIGDYFCSSIIFSLSNKYSIDKSIILAHKNALKYIRRIK